MGLSQNEIDKLTETSPDTQDTADISKAVLEGVMVPFSKAVENIVPVLVGSTSSNVTADEPSSRQFGELIESLPAGNAYFIFTEASLTSAVFLGYLELPVALEVSQKMMGQEGGEELNEALLSALTEALSNILGAYDTSLKEEFGQDVKHGDLKFLEDKSVENLQKEAGMALDNNVWYAQLELTIDDLTGKMGLIISESGLEELVGVHPKSNEAEEASKEDDADSETAPTEESETAPVDQPPPSDVQVARFEELEAKQPSGETRGIDLILDVPLSVTVELGRKNLSIKEILGLTPGSLVELEKLAGEAVDLFVNGKLFAKGEVVVIDENFGVRISSIITPKERIEHIADDS